LFSKNHCALWIVNGVCIICHNGASGGVTKNIGDIYKIYSLIIIINAGIFTSVRYELLKILKMSDIIMLLPYVQLELN
jgi:hypothetical protein